MDVDLASVADELYGLAPEEFTAARAGHEKAAKQAGEDELAAQIHALTKPNRVAWLANQLARERADEIQPLLELGEGLRRATKSLSGDQLRELTQQRHELVYALVQEATRLARAAGHQVSGDTTRGLEDTLHAALADPAAADELAAGRLARGLQRTGFETESTQRAPAQTAKPAKRGRGAGAGKDAGSTQRRRAEQLQRADRDLQRAQEAADEAGQARDEAGTRAEDAEAAEQSAGDEVERLTKELDAATEAHRRAERDARRARTSFDRADRAVRDADRRVADATERRDRLAAEPG